MFNQLIQMTFSSLLRAWIAKRQTLGLLLATLCLFCMPFQVRASEYWGGITKEINTTVTPDNPYIGIVCHIYNSSGKDSYLDQDVHIYVDDTFVGQYDLDFSSSSTLSDRISSGTTYDLIGARNGWGGFSIPWKSGSDYYATLYLSCSSFTAGTSHTLTIKSYWSKDRGTASEVSASKTFTVSSNFSTSNPYGSLYLDAENKVHYECEKFASIPSECQIDINYGTSRSSYTSVYTLGKGETTTTGKTITWNHNTTRTTSTNYYFKYVLSIPNVTFPEKSRVFGTVNIIVAPTSSLTVKGFAKPTNLTGTYNQWTKSMDLTWSTDDTNKDTNGTWMVLRQKSTEPKSTLIEADLNYGTKKYTVSIPDYDATYHYHVSFYPKKRADNYTDVVQDLYTSLLGQTASRTFLYDSLSSQGSTSSITVNWKIKDIFHDTESHTFYIDRVKLPAGQKTTDGLTWTNVGQLFVANNSTQNYSWTDDGSTSPFGSSCAEYVYRIRVNAMDTYFISDEVKGSLDGDWGAYNLTASRGTHANTVKVQWEATQMGSQPTVYTLQRQVMGDEGNWTDIYNTSGTVSLYSYDDATALPGEYYNYRVISRKTCTDGGTSGSMSTQSNITDGFAVAFGVISGRVTYGTGTAVDDVKVILENGDDSDSKDLFHSLRFTGQENAGIVYSADNSVFKKLMANKSWSSQFFVNPETATASQSFMIWDASRTASVYLKWKDASTYTAYVKIAKSKSSKGTVTYGSSLDGGLTIDIPADKWTNLTMAVDADSALWHLTAVLPDGTIKRVSGAWTQGGMPENCISATQISLGTKNGSAFKGYLDEIRFFSGKALTVREIQKNYNHRLAGTENNLAIYWPLDEGLTGQTVAYDYSKTAGAANGRHGTISNASVSTIHPDEDQFAICGVTDENGNYTISGIPFSGDGISYIVRPTKGVHEFQAPQKNLFISGNSLIHSDVDFEDISSFAVSGTVYYQNTNIPLEGANFYVDGVVCSINGEPVTSDTDGKYTISVPIGEHYINVMKSGHTFVNNGRYPSDPKNTGKTEAFIKERTNLSFYDNTLVPVAGRIVGGDVQADKPLGFGKSKNNIGKATITLAIENKSLAKKVNQEATTFELVDTTDIAVASSTNRINSKAIRQACQSEQDLTGEVIIETDSLSGEFCAMLPPLQYKIKSIEVKSQPKALAFPEYSNIIDATDVNNVQTDSITDDGGLHEEFNYVARFDLKYTSEPIFDIVDKTNSRTGMFGVEYLRQTVGGDTEDVKTITDDNKYAYGYPIYQQNGTYKFGLHVYEEYKNYDAKDNVQTDDVDLEGTEIIISNALGEQVQVVADPNDAVDEDGNSYQAGDAYQVGTESVTLDEEGKGTYVWTAGLPNITAPYARGISFYYNKDGKQYNWVNNGEPIAGITEGIQGIIIGDLPTGTNILTQGPDRVLYVLRDPPGTNSSATWTRESSVSYEESYTGSVKNDNEVNTDVSVGTKVTTIQGTIGGMTIFAGQVLEADNMQHIKIDTQTETSVESGTKKSTTVTATSEISTSSGFDFVGQAGDVFVGASTNISYGKANRVDIRKIDGVWTLGVEKQTTLGSEFSTEFTYELNAIEGTIIPEFIEQRNELFRNNITVNSKEEAMSFVNNTSEPIYLTWLSTDDPRYGSSNTDAEIWGEKAANEAKGKFYGNSYVCVLPKNRDKNAVYQDKVLYYNQQVANWENILYENEKAKVQAKQDRKKWLDKNFTFSAGASRTETLETETSSGWTNETSFEITVASGSGTDIDTSFGGVGIEYKIGVTTGGKSSQEQTETSKSSVAYTLEEDGDDDMISVDVYKAPDSFGPIFITRGGQTCAPYEGATYTQYYEPGTQLNEATMQIEKPALYVGNNEKTQLISGVAIGKKANFTLHCKNESETGEDCYFYLIPMQETITGGAILSTSQGPIGTGKFEVYVPAGETTDVVVSLTQNDQSILNYDNIGIRLASTSQYDPTGVNEVIDDTVHISAHFVAGSTDVDMKLANNVMNIGTGTDLGITVQGYDKDWKNLKEIRLQYRGERESEWSNAKIYVPSGKEVEGKTEAIPDNGTISYTLDMSNMSLFPDQTYYFRAQSATSTGATTEATYESEIQTLIKDVTAPQVFGTPRPTNGVLGTGDEISITYNEDIRNNILTEVDNFKITAILNEDEVKHDVALKFENTDKPAAATEASYNLANKSFTTDMWVNVTSAGTIFSHGNGNNKLTLAVDGTGHLVVSIADKTYTSSETMPMGANKWNYLAFNYDNDGSTPQINAIVAYDAYTKTLFGKKNVVAYEGNGRIAVGEKIEGAIQELTLWNKARTMTECQATMYQTKKPSTEGLIGYWKFNEGKDLAAADASRSRSMVLEEANWYLNNTNYAVALDGRSYVNINTSACPVSSTESYAFEMWFKGTSKNASKTLFSVGSDKLSAGFDDNGLMQLTSGDFTLQLGSVNYLDNAWHHFALNVLRTGNATVYVDGTAVGQTSQSNVKALADAYVTLGAKRWDNDGINSFKDFFTGSIDEVRIWNATLSAATIRDAMYSRLSGEEDGLVAYYPFEYQHLDSYNQVVTDLTFTDRITSDTYRTAALTAGEIHGSAPKASDAPALKPNQTETNLQFSYVANERSIIISLNEDADLLDGTTVHITVKSVSDENGNVAKATRWTAYIKQNVLSWAADNVSLKLKSGEKGTFSATLNNQSGSSQDWSLSTLPSWLTADATSGTVSALGNKTVNFTISSATQVGKYEETIYLTDNNGISVPLTVSVNIAGDAPAWSVDANAYDNYKPMVGVIKIKHVLSEDEDDMIGAFINGECRGVAYPEYESDYDTYFVNLRVYGNSSDTDSKVEFKLWDASECKVYPSVITSPDATVLYDADKVSGSYKSPFEWDTDNKIEQSELLEKGWNWISLYVHPDPNKITDVFSTIASKAIQAKNYSKSADMTDGTWTGSLSTVDYNDMYKVQVADTVTLTTLGEEVDATTTAVDIYNGWNWIGVNASYSMALSTAFGDLNPEDGDVVKGQYGFATYDSYTWRGTLKGLTPGLGYVYMSNDNGKKTFHYPSKAAAQTSASSNAKAMSFFSDVENATEKHEAHFSFDGSSYTEYPDNMTVIAKVMDASGAVAGAEVAVTDAEGKIREMQTSDAEGIVFLTIPGNGAAEHFTINVFDGEKEVTAPQSLTYANNAMYGTMNSPFIISAMEATGISSAAIAGVKIYPVNPTSTLNVDAENGVSKIAVYNVDGKLVNSMNADSAQHNEISVASMPAGIYYIAVDVKGIGTTVQSVFKK